MGKGLPTCLFIVLMITWKGRDLRKGDDAMLSSLSRIFMVASALFAAHAAMAQDLVQSACHDGDLDCTFVEQSQTVRIDAHEECRLITNLNASPMMVAHKSALEWSEGDFSFLTNPPPNTIIDFCGSPVTPVVSSFFASAFVDLSGVPANKVVYSNVVTVTGFEGAIPVTLSGGNASELRVNDGAWVTSADVSADDEIQLRHISASIDGGITDTGIAIGAYSDDWASTTSASAGNCFESDGNLSVADGSLRPTIMHGDTVAISLFDGSGTNAFERSANGAINVFCQPSTPVPVWLENLDSLPSENIASTLAPATDDVQFVGFSVDGADPVTAAYWKQGQTLELVVKAPNGLAQVNSRIRINGNYGRQFGRNTIAYTPLGINVPETTLAYSYKAQSTWLTTEAIALGSMTLQSEDVYGGLGLRSLDAAYWPIGYDEYQISARLIYQNGLPSCSGTPCENVTLQILRQGETIWETHAVNTPVTVREGDQARLRYLTGSLSTGRSGMTGLIEFVSGGASSRLLSAVIDWRTLPTSPTTFMSSSVPPGTTGLSEAMLVGGVTGTGCALTQMTAPYPLSNGSILVNGVARGTFVSVCNGDSIQLRVSASALGSGTQNVTLSSSAGQNWSAKTWNVSLQPEITGDVFADSTISRFMSRNSNTITLSNLPKNKAVSVTVTGSTALSKLQLYAGGSMATLKGNVAAGSSTFSVTTDAFGRMKLYLSATRSSTGQIAIPVTLGPSYNNFTRTWTIR